MDKFLATVVKVFLGVLLLCFLGGLIVGLVMPMFR